MNNKDMDRLKDMQTLPKDITISGKKFSLGGVTSHSGGNHFVSFIYDKRSKDFTFYDGMRAGVNESHFRKVLPQDIHKDTLYQAIYFINN